MALSVGPPVIIPFLIFGGFFLNSGSVPEYFTWLSYLSWFRYGNEALLVNQWKDVKEGDIICRMNSTCPASGKVILDTLNFSPVSSRLIFWKRQLTEYFLGQLDHWYSGIDWSDYPVPCIGLSGIVSPHKKQRMKLPYQLNFNVLFVEFLFQREIVVHTQKFCLGQFQFVGLINKRLLYLTEIRFSSDFFFIVHRCSGTPPLIKKKFPVHSTGGRQSY